MLIKFATLGLYVHTHFDGKLNPIFDSAHSAPILNPKP